MGFLTSLFRVATPENPRFTLNSPEAWDAFADGESSTSGVRVNRESALTYSPWWRGINLLSRDIAKCKLQIWRRTGDRKRILAPEHPAFHLVRWSPNPFQTAFVFWQQQMGHALSVGNGYAFIQREGAARPTELWPLDPDCTYPIKANGKLWYITSVDGDTRRIVARDVLHVKGYGFDGLQGYSVWQKAADSLGLGLGTAKYQTIYLRNGARPSVVLECPTTLQPKQVTELRESWERMHSGLENAHRTAVLHNGTTAKPLSFTGQDAQLIEIRKFGIVEVANWIGIPPHKLGDDSRTGYASLEQENKSYLDESLDPWFVNIEQEVRDKLCTEAEKREGQIEPEFDRKALERADTAARAAANRAALGGRPWKTQNEAREEDGLDPLDDPKADQVLEPLNMGQGGADNEEKIPQTQPREAKPKE